MLRKSENHRKAISRQGSSSSRQVSENSAADNCLERHQNRVRRQDQSDEFDAVSTLNPIRVLFGHKILVCLLIVSGAAAGHFRHSQIPAIYQSSAQLQLISPRPVLETRAKRTSTFETSLIDTHLVLIRSPVIIDFALKDDTLHRFSQSHPNTATTIAGGLTVRRSSQSDEFLDLKFTGSSLSHSQVVLEAVINAYVAYLARSQADSSSEDLKQLSEMKAGVLHELTHLETEYAKFRERASLLWEGEQGRNIHSHRLAEIEVKRSSLLVDRSLIESDLKTVNEIGSDVNSNLFLMTIHQIDKRRRKLPNSQQASTNLLIPLMREEKRLLEKLGPNHHKVLDVQRRIQVQKTISGAQTQPHSAHNRKEINPVQTYVASLNHELSVKNQQIEKLNQLFHQEQTAAKLIAMEENLNRTMKEAIERKKRVFDTILSRLESEELTNGNARMTVRSVIAPTPGVQITPNENKSVSVGAILGLIAGLALAAAIEFMDQRIQSADEIRLHFGIPVIGEMTSFKENKERRSQSSPTLVSLNEPASIEAEQFRRIRAALMSHMTGQNQIIQITSPHPSTGKTSLTSNLAIFIAQSGKKTLLIDCDLQRPMIHQTLGIEQGMGLSSVLSGEHKVDEVIKSNFIQNLDVLTAGSSTNNPADILTSAGFATLLKQLRAGYEVIILDSSPVLRNSAALTISPIVDETILVVQLERKSRPTLGNVQEMFDSVGTEISGVVIHHPSRKNGSRNFTF